MLLDCMVYLNVKELYIQDHVYVTGLYVLPTNRADELYILHWVYATGLYDLPTGCAAELNILNQVDVYIILGL